MASSSRSKRQRGPTNSSLFVSQAAEEKFNRFGNQIIAKVVNDDSGFGQNGLEVSNMLRFQGLYQFLSITCNIFPSLVKLFYANLRYHKNDDNSTDYTTLATRVKNVNFTFTKNDITTCFELTDDPEALRVTCEDDILRCIPNFDGQQAVDTICTEPGHMGKGLNVTKLKLECRIIHRIIAYCLEGKTSGTEKLSSLEIFLTWAIFTYVKIDWPHFIFVKIAQGPPRTDSALNFGFAISKLIISKNVDLSNEPVRMFKRQSDLLQETNIRNMGYEIVRGQWQPTARAQQRSGATSSLAMAIRRSQSSHAQPQPASLESIAASQSKIIKTQSKFKKMFKKLFRGLSKLKKKMDVSSSEEEVAADSDDDDSDSHSF